MALVLISYYYKFVIWTVAYALLIRPYYSDEERRLAHGHTCSRLIIDVVAIYALILSADAGKLFTRIICTQIIKFIESFFHFT